MNEEIVPTKPVDNKTLANSGFEDLFRDAPPMANPTGENAAAPTKPVDNKTQPSSGFEDFLKDSPPTVLEKPKADPKNDIMSLFEKVCEIDSN